MTLIQPRSLSHTIDAANAVVFDGGTLTSDQRRTVGAWVAARQGLPGAYAGTFAGLPGELTGGIVTFTGERITSASARHILGEEACRLLRLMNVRDRRVAAALEQADRALQERIDRAALDPRRDNPGLYCCGKCSVGFWRNLLSGGLDRQDERLQHGVAHLRSARDGDRQWRTFPFWYTVLALTDMDFAAARHELEYVAPALERTVARSPGPSPYGTRRRTLAARALARL